MARPLHLHPATPSSGVRTIKVEAARAGTRLELRYVAAGAIGELVLPPPGPAERADALWKSTCFEAFVRASADPGYFELNLAPSHDWASYRFSDYRAGMVEAGDVPAPRIETKVGGATFELRASVDLGEAMGLLADLPWHLGLAAVIEEKEGAKSYWALAHPPGDPDFHHEDCFALELPPAPGP